VGAGAVGSEYACTFGALGTKVHLIDGRDVLLPFLDFEVSATLTRAMGRSGIELDWGERVAECNCAGGEITLTLTLRSPRSPAAKPAAARFTHLVLLRRPAATRTASLCTMRPDYVPTLGALYQDATWRLINERRRAVARAIA